MTTSKKTTAKSNFQKIDAVIDQHFNHGLSLDETALQLTQLGVSFSAIQSTIQKVGIENEWILTPEKIAEKVQAHVKGKTITHFLDVAKLAKSLDISSMSESEKQKAVTDFSGVAKSQVTPSKKFKQFNNSGHMGKIADWVRANPEFSHDEILKAGLIPDAPHRVEYLEEFLAYREFFKSLAC